MAVGVEADDLLRIRPRRLRWNLNGWISEMIIGFMIGIQSADGNGQCTIDGVRARMRADGITQLD